MGRPKSFEQEETLRLAAQAFTVGGYEGTSVDDLVKALDLHRGSLYKAFGSKRGLFLAVLNQYVVTGLPTAVRTVQHGSEEIDLFEALTRTADLDLLLIAALERGSQDEVVASIVRQALDLLEGFLLEDSPDTDARSPASVDSSASRSTPARAIRLMGARLFERLLVDSGQPRDQPDRLRKAPDGADQH